MGKSKRGGYYAVARGHEVGVFLTWYECKAQVDGFKKARFKSFGSADEANQFIAENRSLNEANEFITEDRFLDEPQVPNLQGFIVEAGYVVVYTDGSCSGTGKHARAGIGAWFGDNHPLNLSEPMIGMHTSHHAEIQAAERAISQAKDNGINKLSVKTGSQYVVNAITTWIDVWKRNNWNTLRRKDRNKLLGDRSDLKQLDAAMVNMTVICSYVQSHSGIHGNERADRLAKAGARKQRQ